MKRDLNFQPIFYLVFDRIYAYTDIVYSYTTKFDAWNFDKALIALHRTLDLK